MKVWVCVGSYCHIKGSYDVIQKMQAVIKQYDLEDEVELNASFCLGHCADGVTAKVEDGILLHHVNKDNAEEIFLKEVYPLIKG